MLVFYLNREAATSLISLKYEKKIIKEIHDLSAKLDFKETQKSEESEIFRSTTSKGKDAKRGAKHVLESDDCQIISMENFMQQAEKRTSEPQITNEESHLSPGTEMKDFTVAEAQEMQTKHPDGLKILSGKNSNPNKSNQKKEIGYLKNDTMIGKRVMMLMNGVQCYGTVASFKRSYEVCILNLLFP